MSSTKEKIAELGEELIRKRGYNAFSYHDIAAELGVKNAAIHYHFTSKEDLGVLVIVNTKERFRKMIGVLEGQQAKPKEKVAAFLELYKNSLVQGKVCLVGALSPEYLTIGSKMQGEFQKLINEILEWMTDVLEEGLANRQFSFIVDVKCKAYMVVTNMLGILQLGRVSSKVDFDSLCKGILLELEGGTSDKSKNK